MPEFDSKYANLDLYTVLYFTSHLHINAPLKCCLISPLIYYFGFLNLELGLETIFLGKIGSYSTCTYTYIFFRHTYAIFLNFLKPH